MEVEEGYFCYTEGSSTIPTVTLRTGETRESDSATGRNIFDALKAAFSREGFPVEHLCFNQVVIQPVKDSRNGDMNITVVFDSSKEPKTRFAIKTNKIVGALVEASRIYLSEERRAPDG